MAEEAGGRRPGGFAFNIPGGLEKQFYKRFRALRDKYKLTDRGLIECMVWLALENERIELGIDFRKLTGHYLTTAPVDITLPEVV
jgi:hypothetical protein